MDNTETGQTAGTGDTSVADAWSNAVAATADAFSSGAAAVNEVVKAQAETVTQLLSGGGSTPDQDAVEERIRVAAYQQYLARQESGTEGTETEDWLAAEREVLGGR